MDLITNIITSSTVCGILIWIFREWISTRIKASIQNEYDQKLEAHKAQLKAENDISLLELRTALEREAALHAAAHASFSEGQKAAMERKLKGFDRLWEKLLQIRNNLPSVLTVMDFMSVEEYKIAKQNQNFQRLTGELSPAKMASLFSDVQGLIEEVRPYVGEYMWAIFFSYQTIMIRILVKLHFVPNDLEKVEWYKDAIERQLIESILTPIELQEFDSLTFGKLKWLQNSLESKILSASRKLISGEEFGSESLNQARLIQERAAQLQSKTEIPKI
jgi:hypothetical protein